jgi:hypothetical protein
MTHAYVNSAGKASSDIAKYPESNRFRVASYVLSVACLATILLLLTTPHPWIALAIAAFSCGWSESDGLCGSSHVCSLTPLRASQSHLWLKAVTGYTVGGVVTAAMTGALLGLLGRIVPSSLQWAAIAASAGVALLMISREFGWISFRTLQIRRQTQKMWAMRYGFPIGATMWGAHIGIGLATVIRHGGYYPLVLLALVLGPIKGATIMTSYWLGRALVMWLTPILVDSRFHSNASHVGQQLLAARGAYTLAASAGLLGLLGTAFSMLS